MNVDNDAINKEGVICVWDYLGLLALTSGEARNL